MAVGYNPRIVTDGLVLALDAANLKSYDKYENLIVDSEDITTAAWSTAISGTGVASTVTSNYAAAPDGTLTADRIQMDKGSGTTSTDYSFLVSFHNTVVGQPYVQTVWLKTTDGSTKTVRLSFNGADAKTLTVTGTWQRFFNKTANASDTTRYFRLSLRGGTGTSDSADLLVWGAQVERGTTVTDYYKTTGTAKTRGTTWTDLSGNGNNGTLLSEGGLTISQYSNNNGGYLDFDGANDYIDTGTSFLKTNDNVTLEVFFNHDSNSDDHFLLYEGNTDGFGSQVEFHLYVDGGYLRSWFTTSSGDFHLGGSGFSPEMTVGEWNHAAVTYSNLSTASGASSKLYLNGVEVDSGSGATVNIASMPTSNLLIGKPYSTSLGRRYDGQIAAVKVYNRTLSASEIKQNFNAMRGRFGI